MNKWCNLMLFVVYMLYWDTTYIGIYKHQEVAQKTANELNKIMDKDQGYWHVERIELK